MLEGVMLDFYGTVVHEDDAVVSEICQSISRSGRGEPSASDAGRYWWSLFSSSCGRSYGETFLNQRTLEHASLHNTIEHFNSDSDPDELSNTLYEHWRRPPIFEDAVRFLQAIRLPVVVVSNIDRQDIEDAIAHHDLDFDGVVTSEDVRSYKPRPELFEAGMATLGTRRVLHVGDSQSSDVVGASALGIAVAWVNRQGRWATEGAQPDHRVRDLAELLPILRC